MKCLLFSALKFEIKFVKTQDILPPFYISVISIWWPHLADITYVRYQPIYIGYQDFLTFDYWYRHRPPKCHIGRALKPLRHIILVPGQSPGLFASTACPAFLVLSVLYLVWWYLKVSNWRAPESAAVCFALSHKSTKINFKKILLTVINCKINKTFALDGVFWARLPLCLTALTFLMILHLQVQTSL